MASLTENVVNRVRKLSKPSTFAQAMQPVFEATSNAIFAIEDRFGDRLDDTGKIEVLVEHLGDPDALEIVVSDNGVGLDGERFEAFCEVDTEYKMDRGGKGVGRLFWLDAFKDISVVSSYLDDDNKLVNRAFEFRLRNDEQIVEAEGQRSERGTEISFRGLRQKDYIDHFPKRTDSFERYFISHFIADFLMESSPEITLRIGDYVGSFPADVSQYVVGSSTVVTVDSEDFGYIEVTVFTCLPELSSGLDGFHQMHLLADGRTVESRKVDGLLGLSTLSNDGVDGLALHACVSSGFLNDRVNEGRTAFNIPEALVKRIVRECMEEVKEKVFDRQIAKFREHQAQQYQDFISRYPIFDFDDPKIQLGRVPFNATSAEDFATGLIPYQIRRDEERQENLRQAIAALMQEEGSFEEFTDKIAEAARGVQQAEGLALAQHVVRRKLVLELLEALLRKLRSVGEGKLDNFLEGTLHSVLCPIGVSSEDGKPHGRGHDLWVIDERLAFTRSFSSDKRLDAVLEEKDLSRRPDLLLWNLSYGLGTVDPSDEGDFLDTSEPLKEMLIVELKKPERTAYSRKDNLEAQVTDYIFDIKDGNIRTFAGDRIRIADDCIFNCFIIADLTESLERQLSGWDHTANGKGRFRRLTGDVKGGIELIQWQDLINDAWKRNQATLNAAGLRRTSRLLDEIISDWREIGEGRVQADS